VTLLARTSSVFLRPAIDGLFFWCAAAIEERTLGFRKRLPAGLALVSLTTGSSFAEPDDVVLLIALKVAEIWTEPTWTKVTRLSELGHRPLLVC
jgi:hypothetical protein